MDCRRGGSPELSGILFLDRDGVLNEKAPDGAYVTSVAGLRVLPGVPEALAVLRLELPGVPVVVVTNQRGIARGLVSAATVDDIDAVLLAEVRAAGGDLDAFEVCPHDIDACDCRKPGVGMFRRALQRHPEMSAAESVVVGDSLSDLQAAAALGARGVLVGSTPRRSGVRAAADSMGVPVAAEADSLPQLVASGQLQVWLSVPAVAA
jgi:D-glycero-D-manno-heptose 1,7-bisphosphate phosphatase